jgi:homoserine/homoserine lactone efflux protein
MNWTTWWLFAATETVLCLTPGPAVLFVLSSALRSGARRSLASNAGILAANMVYFVLSATSLGALLAASFDLFSTVKWMGAAYLIFLGLRTLFGKTALLPGGASIERSPLRMFTDGFILQASNPKSILFFTALLPQFINPRLAVVPQVAILAATSAVIEFLVLLGYGVAASQASGLARQPKYVVWTNRVSGLLLIGAGAGLATLRKT